MDYVIRKATPLDIDKMRDLESLCFDKSIRENFDFVLNSNDHIYLILEDKINNSIVAYAGASISYEQGDILSVCVNSNFRKKGYASLVMGELINVLKGKKVEKLFLEVEEENKPAINLYLKLGFAQISIRKNYYGNKSAIIMMKTL